MSENSIDVDVNIHLQGINDIFSKMMEGIDDSQTMEDYFKDIKDKEGLISDMYETTLGEDKTKLLEALHKMNADIPMIDSILKLLDDMNEGQEEGFEDLEGVRSNMVLMIGIAKTMVTMLQENFPITKAVEEELMNVNKALASQEGTLDDRLRLVIRSFSNIFPTQTQSTPNIAFMERTPEGKLSPMETASARNAGVIGEANSLISGFDKLLKRLKENESGVVRMGQFGLEDKIKEMERLKEIMGEMRDILAQSVDLQIVEGLKLAENNLERTTVTTGQQKLIDIDEMVEQQRTSYTQIGIFIDRLDVIVKEMLDKFGGQVESALSFMEGATDAIELLSLKSEDDAIALTNEVKEIKEILAKALMEISGKLDDDLFIKTVQEVWKQAIENELVQPIKTTETAKKLEFILVTVENALNTLNADLEALMRDKTPDELEEMGLGRISVIPNIIEISRQNQERIHGEFGIPLIESSIKEDFDLRSMNEMLKIIGAGDRTKQDLDRKLVDEMSDLRLVMGDILLKTEATSKITKEFGSALTTIRANSGTANAMLTKTQGDLKDSIKKVHEIIDAWNNAGVDKDKVIERD